MSFLLVTACLFWLLAATRAYRVARSIRRLADVEAPAPSPWPRVSLVVPARDEADTVGEALATRLTDDYPDLEVVAVDDRSDDGTRAILDRAAASDPRVRVVHLDDLPAGWLGKVHALERGRQVATGEWILFTDADVHFAPGTLRRAVAWCEARGLDHLAVGPEIERGGFLLDAAVSAFVRVAVLQRLWEIEDPRSPVYVGVGAFNLVRRSAFERSAGLEWLRLEVADDVGLGLLMKRSGARSSLLSGVGSVSVRWYRDVRQMAAGLEKNLFAVVGRCSALRLAFAAAVYLFVELAPLVALVQPSWPVRAAAVLALTAGTLAALRVGKWADRPLASCLVWPVGTVLFAWMMFRAAWLGARRGGIYWRGTFYSSTELREGLRVRLP